MAQLRFVGTRLYGKLKGHSNSRDYRVFNASDQHVGYVVNATFWPQSHTTGHIPVTLSYIELNEIVAFIKRLKKLDYDTARRAAFVAVGLNADGDVRKVREKQKQTCEVAQSG